jgi:hypothetical protein
MGNPLSKKYLTILGFLFICGYSIGQLITIETILDTNQVVLGKTANLKYSVQKNTNDVVKLPVFGDTIFDGIEIIGSVRIDSEKQGQDKELLEQKMAITSYETGMRYIPAQPFLFNGPNGWDTIMSKPGYLNVVGVQVDSTNTIRDISDVEWVMPTFTEMLPYLFGILGLGLVVFLIYYYWPGRRAKMEEHKPAKQVEPPHIIALRELDKLKAQKLWQQKQVKEYYTKLTHIIRVYIEEQFGVSAMEETTSEILRDIRKEGLDKKIDMHQLEGLLNLADLIKFARGEAQPQENIEQLEAAYEFVKNSRKVFVEGATQQVAERLNQQMSNSFSLSWKIKNVGNISDLEVYHKLENGARLVQYSYTVSILVMTFSRRSKLYLLEPGEKGKKQGIIFSVITGLFGWWGIPWGPVRSIRSLKINFSGGKKVQIN